MADLIRKRKSFCLFETLYLLILGLMGWAVLIYISFINTPQTFINQYTPLFFLFLLLGFFSRMMAFSVKGITDVSLDSAYYMAAVFVIKSIPAAWVVVICFGIDYIIRWVQREHLGQGTFRPLYYNVARIIHNTGAIAVLLPMMGYIFNLDRIDFASHNHPVWSIVLYVVLLSIIFLITHYFIACIRFWLAGNSWDSVIFEVVIPSVNAELLVIPFSIIMVAVYSPQQPFILVILAAACMLINFVFKKLSDASGELSMRISELTTINKIGREINSSLQLNIIFARLAGETLKLMDSSSLFIIGINNVKTRRVYMEIFNADGKSIEQKELNFGAGLSGYVMKNRQTLQLNNLQVERGKYIDSDRYKDPEFHSWLGVPLQFHEECVGIINVQSKIRNAYSEDNIRLMESIAQQATVAIQNAKLYELATIDGLTQVYVRRYFDHRLSEEWERCRRYNTFFSLGMFDLDHFKNLNDQYGHQVGDYVLRKISAILKQNMRNIDIPARYGGEEFTFILPRTSAEDAFIVAERIRKDIARHELKVGDETINVTASFGIASYPESGRDNHETLLENADFALYRAKEKGRNRTINFQSLTRAEVARLREEKKD